MNKKLYLVCIYILNICHSCQAQHGVIITVNHIIINIMMGQAVPEGKEKIITHAIYMQHGGPEWSIWFTMITQQIYNAWRNNSG